MSGSSPLTRGKPRPESSGTRGGRLIPAHAGKTCHRGGASRRRRAHPRSRGENTSTQNCLPFLKGSSPLTRGKPRPWRRSLRSGRLIPAHAGKTAPRARSWRPSSAHPRSRGENPTCRCWPPRLGGSSPLTRGKPLRSARTSHKPGLIPAHAGKTPYQLGNMLVLTAHPRSRGENRIVEVAGLGDQGSSPLTRGKPASRQTTSEVTGLIPAHAGKTARA